MGSLMPGLRALIGVKLSQILAPYTCLQLPLTGHKVDWDPNRRYKCKADGFLFSFFIILQQEMEPTGILFLYFLRDFVPIKLSL